MRYVEELVHIRDLKIGDILDSLEAKVIGRENIPASNIHAVSDVHFPLSDGRVLMQRDRMVVRCRHGDVKKIISSVAVPEHIKVRREAPKSKQVEETDGGMPKDLWSNRGWR